MSKTMNYRSTNGSSTGYENRRVYDMKQNGLKITIKRLGIIAAASSLPPKVDIDDHAKICEYVHIRKDGNEDVPRVPIFGKCIIENQYFSNTQQASSSRKSRRRARSRSAEKTRRRNRPGEYRPGHRDLSKGGLTNKSRSRSPMVSRRGEFRSSRSAKDSSRSRSPNLSSRRTFRSEIPRDSSRRKTRRRTPKQSKRSRDRYSEYKAVRSKSRLPPSTSSRSSKSSAENPFMPMPGMGYEFYDRCILPTNAAVPRSGSYGLHDLMTSRMFMNSMMPPIPFRHWIFYKSAAAEKKTTKTPITTEKQEPTDDDELPSDQQDVSSSTLENAVGNSAFEA